MLPKPAGYALVKMPLAGEVTWTSFCLEEDWQTVVTIPLYLGSNCQPLWQSLSMLRTLVQLRLN